MNIGDVWILKDDDGSEIEMMIISIDEETGIIQSITKQPS